MNRLDFNQGIRAASNLLIKTAEDFEQSHKMMLPLAIAAKERQALGWAERIRYCAELKAKAELLRGQSSLILDTLTK